jgi:hypothetical protein
MTDTHPTHESHDHEHASDCGHVVIRHESHVDFLHDGHLHHVHEGHVDEHALLASTANPSDCASGHACNAHERAHRHDPQCGHESVPHADHVDYLVDGHLHNRHSDHCDNHGRLERA